MLYKSPMVYIYKNISSKSTPFEYFLFYFSRNICWCLNGFTDKTELGQLLFKLCLNFNF